MTLATILIVAYVNNHIKYKTVSTVSKDMSHSLTKIWIHAVFGTKNFQPIIHQQLENNLYRHIRDHLEKDYESSVNAINGMPDHIHILFRLNPNYSVKDILKNIKGESSHWVNQDNLTTFKFAWQTGYGAFSVSESNVEIVSRYIQHQKEHHKKIFFAEEYEKFMKKHGLPSQKETSTSINNTILE